MATSNFTPSKRCSKCGVEYPSATEYWHRYKNSPDGFAPACKFCERERSRKYYQANRDKRLKAIDEYQRSNPEKRRVISRRHYQRHQEQEKARASAYKRANPEITRRHALEFYYRNKASLEFMEKRRASLRNHYRNNKGEYLHKWRKRDIIKRGADGNHTTQDIEQLYDRQGGLCAYCGVELKHKYEVDHVIPLSRGGSNNKSNLALACQYCNRSKGSKLLSEWVNEPSVQWIIEKE